MDITWAADLTLPSTPVVAIDANNNLTINGVPIFLVGATVGYVAWKYGGYSEAQADAMLSEAATGGWNFEAGDTANMGTYLAAPYQNMESILVQQAKFGIYAGYSFSKGMTGWSPAVPYPPLQPIETTNINTYKVRSMVAWQWVSEPVFSYYATLLPHYQLALNLDPQHPVVRTQGIPDGRNHGFANSYGSGAIADSGYWDEGVNARGLAIPIVEIVLHPAADNLWEYVFFMNRRLRGLSKAAPSGQLSAAVGSAGALTGTYRFVYTWSYGTGYRDPDAVESFASSASVDLTVSSQQITLTGFQDPGAGNTINVYAFKVGVSASDGMWPTSNYGLVVAGLSHTTTTYTVTTDYPWMLDHGISAAPPPRVSSLGWMPSISTTPLAELFDYVKITSKANIQTLDQTSRWYWLQVAMNCRTFDVLYANWERCPTGNNFPVVLVLTQNTKIAFVSDTVGDTRTCSIEGILTDGVTIAREDNIVLNGTTSVQTANTYSLVKWVAVQTSHATATITVTQVTGGNNILGTHPYFGGNPPFVMAAGSDSAYFKAGNDGLPDGYLQAWHDTWTVLGRIKGFASVITAVGPWARIGSVTPAFVVQDDSGSLVNFKGLYAAKKTVGSVLYVIAVNFDQADGPTGSGGIRTDRSLTGATIDVGQTITTCVRIAGESGSPSFTGSVITDNFTPAQVHVYQIT